MWNDLQLKIIENQDLIGTKTTFNLIHKQKVIFLFKRFYIL